MAKKISKKLQFGELEKLQKMQRLQNEVRHINIISDLFVNIVGVEKMKEYAKIAMEITFFIPRGPKSGNTKTGSNIFQYYGSQKTCPATSCIFNKIGCCYAKHGHCAYWFDVAGGRLAKTPKTHQMKKYYNHVHELPELIAARGNGNGRLWRVNVSGDICATGTNNINPAYLAMIAGSMIGAGYKPYTYTHAAKTYTNLQILKAINNYGMTINASCEKLEDVEKVLATGVPAVLAVEKMGAKLVKKNGVNYVHCLAQACPGRTCENCQICTRAKRNCVVVFEGHGPAGVVKKIRESGALIKELK